MSAVRLSTIAPDLVTLLDGKEPLQLSGVSEAIVDWVFKAVAVTDPRAIAGRAALAKQSLGDSIVRSAVWELVEELDNTAWDSQDEDQDEATDEQAYLDAFARARAVNSLWYALGGAASESTMECAYEAQAAYGDLDGIRTVVFAAISGGGGRAG